MYVYWSWSGWSISQVAIFPVNSERLYFKTTFAGSWNARYSRCWPHFAWIVQQKVCSNQYVFLVLSLSYSPKISVFRTSGTGGPMCSTDGFYHIYSEQYFFSSIIVINHLIYFFPVKYLFRWREKRRNGLKTFFLSFDFSFISHFCIPFALPLSPHPSSSIPFPLSPIPHSSSPIPFHASRFSHCPLPIAHWPLCAPLPITHFPLSIALPTAHHPLSVVRCPFPLAHTTLPLAHFPLPIANGPLPLDYCQLPLAPCVMPLVSCHFALPVGPCPYPFATFIPHSFPPFPHS